MLSLKFIRENSKLVKETLKHRGMTVDIDRLLELDSQRRTLSAQLNELEHKRNVASDEIASMKKAKLDTKEKIDQMKTASRQIKDLDKKVNQLSEKIEKDLDEVPNIPHPSVPIGAGPSANKVIREWGKKKNFSFIPHDHIEISEILEIIDFPRAAKISGAGFSLFVGEGAKLERALINFMLDLHTKRHGYKEIFPPFLVNRKSMRGTGQLPKLEEDMYRLKDDDLFLIPTAEVPVTNIYQDEVLDGAKLPLYYTAYTACFRREAGSYGKDTKGLIRVHQFDKVELVKFVKPETSYDELEKLLNDAEEVLQLLGIPYRVVALSTGDLSFAASKCYDIEAWAPGTEKYLEVSSCSNFESFQARRANIRYTLDGTKKTNFVHTLNGSGVALARTLICLVENHQQSDGSMIIPKALRPYMDGKEKISPILDARC